MINKDFISIVIIVKNDRGVENTLNKLRSITRPVACEILVIDASNGRIDDIRDKFPEVRWIYYPTLNIKKTTIPEQRNLGVKESKGNIVVFIDADCVPVKNWLNELYKLYRKDHESIVAGIVIPTKSTVWNNLYDLSDKSVYRNECPTANLLISKKVFEKIGYFDENLLYGEDVDLTWRAVSAGFKIRLTNKAIVRNEWGSFWDEVDRAYRYGKARAMLYKKHTYRWRNIISQEKVILMYAGYLLLLPVTIIIPFYPLFILIPFIKNIRKQPLRMIFKLLLINLVNAIGLIKGILFNY